MYLLVAVVVLVGLALAGLGAVSAAVPRQFHRLLLLVEQKRWLNLAMLLRLLIGVVMLAAAPGTRLPRFVLAAGIVTLLSGLLSPLLGHDRLVRMAAWWARRPDGLVRLWGLLAFALGLLIVYAAV
ncbi:MAG: hypothetical protein ACE147_18885 [Candidatus Methylomirabilales bacterium]